MIFLAAFCGGFLGGLASWQAAARFLAWADEQATGKCDSPERDPQQRY